MCIHLILYTYKFVRTYSFQTNLCVHIPLKLARLYRAIPIYNTYTYTCGYILSYIRTNLCVHIRFKKNCAYIFVSNLLASIVQSLYIIYMIYIRTHVYIYILSYIHTNLCVHIRICVYIYIYATTCLPLSCNDYTHDKYIHMCACVYMCTNCIYTFMRVHIYVYIYVFIYVFMYGNVYICVYVYIYVYIHIYKYIYINTCIYIYLNIFIYMYMYVYM